MQCGGGCMRKLQRVDVVAMYQNDRLALPQGGACGCATGRHRPACDDTGHAAQSAHRPLSQHQQARQPSCSTGRVAFRTAAHWTWHPIQSAPCHRRDKASYLNNNWSLDRVYAFFKEIGHFGPHPPPNFWPRRADDQSSLFVTILLRKSDFLLVHKFAAL